MKRKVWEPLENGYYGDIGIENDGETVSLFVDEDYGYISTDAPADIRPCRLVDTPACVPPLIPLTPELRHALEVAETAIEESTQNRGAMTENEYVKWQNQCQTALVLLRAALAAAEGVGDDN